jgi:DNA ligase-1
VKRLAAALDRARARRSRIEKEEAIAAGLADAAPQGEAALAIAARLSAGRMLPVGDSRSLGVGFSILLEVVARATGYPEGIVLASSRKTGELAQAFALLLARVQGAEAREGLDLGSVRELGEKLAGEPGRGGKRALLDAAFARTTPLEAKYLAKALGGEMRIGAQDGVVQGAIGRAFGVPAEELRRAAALVADPGDLAVLAARHRTSDASLTVGHPVGFMLATPYEAIASFEAPGAYALEDKIDGVRAQVHRSAGGRVEIFGRSLDRVTDAFPEVVEALSGAPGAVVLDGEIVAVAPDGRPRPFQALQPRLRKGAPSQADLEEAAVNLVAFDVLHEDGESLLDRPFHERRARLEAFVARLASPSVVLNRSRPMPPDQEMRAALDAEYAASRSRGHEGLVLKRTDAPYEAGRRGQAWIKFKKANATLDVVVVAAERGHGRRAGVLSDYTFAVWHDGQLLPVGKAYSGLTDAEIDAMTRRMEASTTERRGGLHLVRPEVVLEVGFDGVQKSTRHPSGFALRFPRILRVRDDKTPEAADTLAAVEAIFGSQVASGHREEQAKPRARPRKPKAKKDERQLKLFGD